LNDKPALGRRISLPRYLLLLFCWSEPLSLARGTSDLGD